MSLLALALALVAANANANADDYSVDAPNPQGVWLHAAAGAGYVGRDGVVGLEAGIGLETQPFAAHLAVPLMLRVIDLPPVVDAGAPAACHGVRCEEWLAGDRISAEALGRAVDEVRVLEPGDLFYLKAGRVFATLGHGALVDEYTNSADWDRRHTGIYAESNLPWAKAQVQLVAGDFLAPQELYAVRASASPLASTSEDAQALDRFLGRMRLGVETAGDLAAPVTPVDGNGDVVPGSQARPLLGAAADLTWPLFDDDSGFQLAPYASASASYGLVAGARADPSLGAGGAVGVDGTIDIVVVALRMGARAFADSPAHRSALFDTLYDVDRRRYALAGGGFSTGGIATLPSPGGVGAGLDVEVLVLRAVKAGARLRLDPVPEARRAEVYAEVDAGAVRASVRAIEHGFVSSVSSDRTLLVADCAWQIAAPFSLVVRWLHGPRFHSGLPLADDDVFAGASFDLVLGPA